MTAFALAAALILAAPPKVPQPSREVVQGRSETAAVVEASDTVELSLVKFQMVKVDGVPQAKLAPRTEARTLDGRDAALVRTLVAGLMRAPEGGRKLCGFNPDLRVVFKKGDRSVEAVFCFSCSDVQIMPPEGTKYAGRMTDFGAQAKQLKALIARVYKDLPEEKRAVGQHGY